MVLKILRDASRKSGLIKVLLQELISTRKYEMPWKEYLRVWLTSCSERERMRVRKSSSKRCSSTAGTGIPSEIEKSFVRLLR